MSISDNEQLRQSRERCGCTVLYQLKSREATLTCNHVTHDLGILRHSTSRAASPAPQRQEHGNLFLKPCNSEYPSSNNVMAEHGLLEGRSRNPVLRKLLTI